MSGLKVSLLGGMEICPDGGAPEPAVTRKAGAMIAFLALQHGHAQSREKLAGLLWSHNTDDQARTNLRQALSRLRKALSNGDDGLLVADASRVRLDPDKLDLDVTRFEGLAADGSPDSLEAALALYRGDLLDGVSLNEEAFEDWLRGERERLRSVAITALEKLAGHYESTKDMARCIAAAARLVAMDPLREAAHRTLMRAYAAQGRQALALKQYQRCHDIMRRELGVEPDGDTRALYRNIREKRGEATADGPVTGLLQRALATAEMLQGEDAPALDLPERPSVAVLPFENRSGDAAQDYFADGVTENIITGLTRFRDLFVIAPKTALMARGLAGDPREAGAELGVAHVVEGSIRKAGNRVRATVRLLDATDGHQVWAEQYDRDLDDVFAVQDEISERIVATLVGRIEEASLRRAERKAPADMTAFDHLLRARPPLNSYTMDGILKSRRLLDKALEIDPGFAAAWAELSRSFIAEYESNWTKDRAAALERARELAGKAVALDGADTVARYALANAHFYGKRQELASAEIDRALALNPNDYHNLCSKGWFLVFMGRVEEGMACSREAMRFTPFAPDNCMLIFGFGEYMEHRYEAAIEVLGRVTAPSVWRDSFLAASYAQLSHVNEARAIAAGIRNMAADVGDSDDPASWRAFWENWFCYEDSTGLDHLMEGLRKAGLPG